MRIRVWNAFAGNNSGSYTIVGRFRDAAQADEIVGLLTPLILEQTRWFANPQSARPSPLERLAIQDSLEWDAEDGDWPEYGGKESPEILRIGNQVLIHHDYTVSLPRFFGRLFYARGGAVDVILDHAHARLVASFQVWWPWNSEAQARVPSLSKALASELLAVGSPLQTHSAPGVKPVVHEHGSGFALDTFRILAVFDDLVAGVDGVRVIVEKHEGRILLQLSEEMDATGDPLASARRPEDRLRGT
ncbi:MAG: hypothetical protein HYZ53_22505 [Planctomycetes bacterium]|nr:hypothetical protein [Planctomycetota bacterium]